MDAVMLIFAVLAALLLWLLWRSLRRGRWLSASSHLFQLALVLACFGLLAAVGLNLQTYRQLSYEQEVAVLAFRRVAPQLFQANIRMADGQSRLVNLHGDEWQLDARVLKWKPWANVLGLSAQYRLQRLSGRYTREDDELSKPRSAYRLYDEQGLDLWTHAQSLPSWLPVVDAEYGSAAYLPMRDGAHYRVSLSQSGLVAREFKPTDAGWSW